MTLVSSIRFIWMPILLVYNQQQILYLFRARIDSWHKLQISIYALKGPIKGSLMSIDNYYHVTFIHDDFIANLPARSIFALPMGMVKSGDIAWSVISKGTPYIISFSRKTTGSLSLMAAFSRPLQSSEFQGDNTFRPGQLLYQEAKHCECWAPTPDAAPLGPRKTIGTFTWKENKPNIHPVGDPDWPLNTSPAELFVSNCWSNCWSNFQLQMMKNIYIYEK